MKSVVIGLGVQGEKRIKTLGADLAGVVDLNVSKSIVRTLGEIPLLNYDAVFCCVPDQEKRFVVNECLAAKKSILIEKPLILKDIQDFSNIEKEANSKEIFILTAYNHRFEPNIVKLKELLMSNELGKVLGVKCFYGNGTASLVKKSDWRNSSHGVSIDIFSHIFDLLIFLFGYKSYNLTSKTWSHVTKCADQAVVIGQYDKFSVVLEANYLSWKNTFQLELICEEGTFMINGLCKWSESTLEIRHRVYPAGVPNIEKMVVPKGDPTWNEEKLFFFNQIKSKVKTSLQRDVAVQEMLTHCGFLEEQPI